MGLYSAGLIFNPFFGKPTNKQPKGGLIQGVAKKNEAVSKLLIKSLILNIFHRFFKLAFSSKLQTCVQIYFWFQEDLKILLGIKVEEGKIKFNIKLQYASNMAMYELSMDW